MALLRSIVRPSMSLLVTRHITEQMIAADSVVKTCLARPVFVPTSHFQNPSSSSSSSSSRFFSTSVLTSELKSKLDDVVKKDKVVVFMKGVPDAPKCGFSNAVVQILKMHGAPIAAYDVLSDQELREGVKEYSNWPTIPQVYIDGTFVGGCDILLSIHRSRELIEILEKAGIKSSLADDDIEVDGKCKK